VTLLFFAAASSLFDFFSRLFEGMQGGAAAVYFFVSVSLIMQNITLYMFVVFLDYMLKKNIRRTKKAITYTTIVIALYMVSVLANLLFHYYFYVADGAIVYTDYFAVSLAATYFPLLLVFLNLSLNIKSAGSGYINLLFVFIAIAAVCGIIDDFLLKEGNLFLPGLASAFLYIYFFIIQNDAKIDTLTGINNRYAFNEFINRISKQLAVKSYAIALIDLDYFKKINDMFGHAEGDNALCDVARIVMTSIRHTDFAARYGGDEFIIVTDSAQSIGIILERIESALKAQNVSGSHQYQLEISYGTGVYTSNSNQNIDLFLDHIDRLMYEHKNSKTNR
jgi:diguanylate cyclase (GGDEF)-like protein